MNHESRSRYIIDGSFELQSSRCMHESSFMALALIVLEKMTKMQKTRQKFTPPPPMMTTTPEKQYICLQMKQ